MTYQERDLEAVADAIDEVLQRLTEPDDEPISLDDMSKQCAQAALSAMPAVRVKKLEWVNHDGQADDAWTRFEGTCDTNKVVGYYIEKDGDNFMLTLGQNFLGSFGSMGQAKFAAETHAKKLVADLLETVDHSELVDALKLAGDYIECYHKSTGIDLGDASRMPFVKDVLAEIDAALSGVVTEDKG